MNKDIIDKIGSPQEYGRFLVDECRRGVGKLLPFTEAEMDFLDLILEQGKIDDSLLTTDPNLMKRIEDQPSLKWKALNVRKHKGLG